jgi:hypothetical protein
MLVRVIRHWSGPVAAAAARGGWREEGGVHVRGKKYSAAVNDIR